MKDLLKVFLFLTTFFIFSSSPVFAIEITGTNSPDAPRSLTLAGDKEVITADGQDTLNLVVTLKDRTTFVPLEANNKAAPIPNAPLTFTVTGSGNTFSQTSSSTDANGQITAILKSTVAETKIITVHDTSQEIGNFDPSFTQASITVTSTAPATPTPSPLPTPTPFHRECVVSFGQKRCEKVAGEGENQCWYDSDCVTPTPTWYPKGPIKTDKDKSVVEIDKTMVETNTGEVTVTIHLYDKDGNPVTDELPKVTTSGESGCCRIKQPTDFKNPQATVSSHIPGEQKIIVKVGDVELSDQPTVYFYPTTGIIETPIVLDLTASFPSKLTLHGLRPIPVSITTSKDLPLDKIEVELDCGTIYHEKVSLGKKDKNGTLFMGELPAVPGAATIGSVSCTLRITPTYSPSETTVQTRPTPTPIPPIPVDLIDPYGYVHNAKTKERIAKAKVTLFSQENGTWKIWNAEKYDQINPQYTDLYGQYSFWVPEGKYYLIVEAEGYRKYKSEILEVEDLPINFDVPLTPLFVGSTSFYVALALILTLILISFYWRKRRGQLPLLIAKLRSLIKPDTSSQS